MEQPRAQDTDDDFWGPEPTADEYAEAVTWQDTEQKRRLFAVLRKCVSIERLRIETEQPEGPGFDIEIAGKIFKRDIIAIDLGEAGMHIPTWQFVRVEVDQLTLAQHPDVTRAWEAYTKVDPLNFSYYFAHMPRNEEGQSYADMIHSQKPTDTQPPSE